MTSKPSVTVFVEPITYHFAQDRLFEKHKHAGSYYEPFAAVRAAFAPYGIEVHTADHMREGRFLGDVNVYFSIGNTKHYRRLVSRRDVVLSALFHFEAPIIHPSVYRETPAAARHFGSIYSFSTSEGLAPFGCGGVDLKSFRIPEPRREVYEDLWQRTDRDFLVMISQNKRSMRSYNQIYTERLRAFEHYADTGSFDLYGVGWDQMPFKVGERRTPQHVVRAYRSVRQRLPFDELYPGHATVRKVYRGVVDSKYEAMSRYTFALCYENMTLEGWINEKIFDAFLAGTIPIYLGAPDVADWVPKEAFIDRREFENYTELDSFLRSLGPAEVAQYREAARDFLASEQFEPFSKEAFADIFVRSLEHDLGTNVEALAA